MEHYVQNSSPSSERMTKGWDLKRQLLNSLRWPIYVIKSVDNIKLPFFYSPTDVAPQFFKKRTSLLGMCYWMVSYSWNRE